VNGWIIGAKHKWHAGVYEVFYRVFCDRLHLASQEIARKAYFNANLFRRQKIQKAGFGGRSQGVRDAIRVALSDRPIDIGRDEGFTGVDGDAKAHFFLDFAKVAP
jgi:hypothetical protein